MTTVSPTPDSPAAPAAERNFIRFLVFLAGAALLLAVLGGYNSWRTGAWQHYVNTAALAAFLPYAVYLRWLAKRGRINLAVGLTIAGMAVVLLVVTGTLANVGLVTALGLMVVATLLISLTLPGEMFSRGVVLILLGGLVILLLDLQSIPFRMEMENVPLGAAIGVVALLAIIYALAILRRINTLSISVKLTLTLLLVTIVPIVAMAVFYAVSTERFLSAEANQRLTIAAEQTSLRIDQYLTSQMDSMALDAEHPVVREFLSGKLVDETLQPSPALMEALRNMERSHPDNPQVFLLYNRDGEILVSSNELPLSNRALTEQRAELVRRVALIGVPTMSNVEVNNFGVTSYMIVARVNDLDGKPAGAIAARFDGEALQELIASQNNFGGDGSYAILLDYDRIVLAHGLLPESRFKLLNWVTDERLAELIAAFRLPNYAKEELSLNLPAIEKGLQALNMEPMLQAIIDRLDPNSPMQDAVHRAATAELASRTWTVVFAQPESIFLAPVRAQVRISGSIALIAALIVSVIAVFLSSVLVSPIRNLTNVAKEIAGGDLTRRARVSGGDEIGELAQNFNEMTARLRESLETLEHRVNERTADLRRRSGYLEASAEVSQTANTSLNTADLIQQVVNLILDRFSLYYVGLFLVDDYREWAQLKAGTGPAGQAMLARGHRIRIGEGMVGWCIANGQPRVALHAHEDSVRLATAELPLTRSEAALPLRSRGTVLGALTVQSAHPNAFDQDALTVLQTMADQVAVAFENAMLFTQAQDALESTRRAYGEISQKGWRDLLRGRGIWQYRYDRRSANAHIRLLDEHGSETEQPAPPATDAPHLALPIKVRDQVVGVMNLRKDAGEAEWSSAEREILESLSDHLGQALESARLYHETQRKAERERLTAQIVSRVRASNDPQTILQTAAEELRQALGVRKANVVLQRGGEPAAAKPAQPAPPTNGGEEEQPE